MIDFSGLYQTHASNVRRFALFLSGDPARADDIVAETFIRLWHCRERVDLTTVRAYLLTIARNLFLQQERQVRRAAPLELDPPDTRPGPEQQATARDELRAVVAALRTLPEIDRAAILMRADEGLSYAEIAAALAITEAAARVKVHRSRLKLAEARHAVGPGAADGRERER